MDFIQKKTESTVIIDMMIGEHSTAIEDTETTAVIDMVVSEKTAQRLELQRCPWRLIGDWRISVLAELYTVVD